MTAHIQDAARKLNFLPHPFGAALTLKLAQSNQNWSECLKVWYVVIIKYSSKDGVFCPLPQSPLHGWVYFITVLLSLVVCFHNYALSTVSLHIILYVFYIKRNYEWLDRTDLGKCTHLYDEIHGTINNNCSLYFVV